MRTSKTALGFGNSRSSLGHGLRPHDEPREHRGGASARALARRRGVPARPARHRLLAPPADAAQQGCRASQGLGLREGPARLVGSAGPTDAIKALLDERRAPDARVAARLEDVRRLWPGRRSRRDGRHRGTGASRTARPSARPTGEPPARCGRGSCRRRGEPRPITAWAVATWSTRGNTR